MKILPILFATYLISAFGASGVVLAEGSNVRSAIESLNAAWNKAFNSGDASALAAMYHEQATVSPGNGEVLKGRADIEELFQSYIDGGLHNHGIDIVTVHRDGDLAYEVANWSASGPAKDGEKPTFGGVLINVFQKGADGTWKSLSHVWNASTD